MLSMIGGAAAQNLQVHIREAWDGPDLASAALASSALNPTWTWHAIDISDDPDTDLRRLEQRIAGLFTGLGDLS